MARAITPTVERIFPDAQVVHRVVAAPRFDENGRLVAATGLAKLVGDTHGRLHVESGSEGSPRSSGGGHGEHSIVEPSNGVDVIVRPL